MISIIKWQYLNCNHLELPKLCYHPGWRLMRLGYRMCFHTLYDEKKKKKMMTFMIKWQSWDKLVVHLNKLWCQNILFNKMFFGKIQHCVSAISSILTIHSSMRLFLVSWTENSSLQKDLSMWRTFKEIWQCSFTLYQKKSFRGASTNENLAGMCWMTRDLFWRNLTFHSLFIYVLVNKATIGILFKCIIYIYIYIYIPGLASSSHADSTEFSDCLSPFIPIFYHSWHVLLTAFSIHTKLIM